MSLRLGLDLGTTTLAGALWDSAGRQLALAQVDNPQLPFGSDVIQRLEAAQSGAGAELQRLLAAGINQLVDALLRSAGATRAAIGMALAAANPAISHLLAGWPVGSLLRPPHRPAQAAGAWLEPAVLGIDLPVPLGLLPLVSGYVGGDLLAVLLGSPPEAGPTLYIDLGTNAELALWDGSKWRVTSVAAGPAFEAGNLSCGLRFGAGAVTDVRIEDDRLRLQVAGGGVPRGLCGSGLFATVGCGVEAGLVAADGRLRAQGEVASNLSRYLGEDHHGRYLQLYRDARGCLRLTQEDLRAFQLAKGAVRAGVECLLARCELSAAEVVSVRIAGALGGALPVPALKGVALLPEIMLENALFLPDAVLAGVAHLLTCDAPLATARALAQRLQPYPLSGTPAFERAFLAALDFR